MSARPRPSSDSDDLDEEYDGERESDGEILSSRARRSKQNAAVSAKKVLKRRKEIAGNDKAKKERCLSELGPRDGWTQDQLELDNEVKVGVDPNK